MFTNPMFATNDPSSSAKAAKAMKSSGKQIVNALKVYKLLKKNQGATAVELYAAQGAKKTLTRHEISRRLPDMLSVGCVKQCPQRKCKVNKRAMVTWRTSGPFVPKQGGSSHVSVMAVLTATVAAVAAVRKALPKGGKFRQALYRVEDLARRGTPPSMDEVMSFLEK